MIRFRYNTANTWYKGNTHLHSILSDGGLTFPEIERRYLETGHDFLCRTDHRIASDTGKDDFESSLLWIDGVELDGTDSAGGWYHVVCLGNVQAQTQEMPLEDAMRMNRDLGAILILAHPHWSGNTLEDAVRHGFDGVEVYNNVCHWLNGKGSGLVHWEEMLKKDPMALGLSVDDAHLKDDCPPYNGGWIMVNTTSCTTDAILEGIRLGNFYSSCGPEIHSLEWDGNAVRATFSPVQFVRVVGPGPRSIRAPYIAPEGEGLTEHTFTVEPEKWPFLYLEIVDKHGRRAWTNNLFEGV